MKTQTSIVAKQVHLQQWALQIKECQSRPKGMKVETWCLEQGISKANYYYRLKCVRKAYLEQVGVGQQSHDFVELPPPEVEKQVEPADEKESHNTTPVAILRGPNNVFVELLPTATSDFLTALIGAFNHVE
jgi:hypothetical protein